MVKIAPIEEHFDWNNRVMIAFLDTKYWWNDFIKFNDFVQSNTNVALSVSKDASILAGTYSSANYRIIRAPLLNEIKFPDEITKYQPLIGTEQLFKITEGAEKYTAGVAGVALGSFMKLRTLQSWKETKPLSFSFTLHFDTDTSPCIDAYMPAMALFGYTLPEDLDNGMMAVPALSLKDLFSKVGKKEGDIVDATQLQDKSMTLNSIQQNLIDNGARLVSVMLSNTIYLKTALLSSATPTFSKELTESGFPLWTEVECKVESLEIVTVNTLMGMMKTAKYTDSSAFSDLTKKRFLGEPIYENGVLVGYL